MRKEILLLIMLALLLIIPAAASANENATVLEDSDSSYDHDVYIEISSMGTHKYGLQGEEINFTVSVNNYGPKTARNVTVNTAMPGDLPFNLTVSKGTFDNETGIWTIGDLKANKKIAKMNITAKSDVLGKYTFDFNAKCDSKLLKHSTDEHTVYVFILTKEEFEDAFKDDGPVSAEDNVRKAEQRSYYSASDYSNYRQVTKSADNRKANAKSSASSVSNDNGQGNPSKTNKNQTKGNSNGTNSTGLNENKTANPIALVLLGITVLIATRFKTKFK